MKAFRRLWTWFSARPDSPRRDDREGGVGVLVPVGPRPRRDGAHARPPAVPEEELVGVTAPPKPR